MARVTQAMRTKMQAEAYSRLVCECGHPQMNHHELVRDFFEIRDGVIAEVPNPDYRPLHFHCDHAECDCVRVVTL